MKIISKTDIQAALDIDKAIAEIEEGFVAYSEGRVNVPPVTYLPFQNPAGDCHIKCGHIEGDDVFVIKVSTGFYGNIDKGLPSSNGYMTILSAQTGQPLILLNDEGFLTDIRTAISGFIAAKYLAPSTVTCIGIVGTGIQARLQLSLLKKLYPQSTAIVWGRTPEKLSGYISDMAQDGHEVIISDTLQALCEKSDLIVTTTPSPKALIQSDWIQAGQHITAVGADAAGKQEIEAALFGRTHIIVADSRDQCIDHGDISYAVHDSIIQQGQIIEIGEIIKNPEKRRLNDKQITIADLTGVAVQDIQIAKHISQYFLS